MPGRQGEEGYYENLQPQRGGYVRGRGAQGRDNVAQTLPRGQARGRPSRGARGQNLPRGDHQYRGGNRGQYGGGHQGYPDPNHRGGSFRGKHKGGDRDGERGGTCRRPNRGPYENRGYNDDYHRSYTSAENGNIPVITTIATEDDAGDNHFNTGWNDY